MAIILTKRNEVLKGMYHILNTRRVVGSKAYLGLSSPPVHTLRVAAVVACRIVQIYGLKFDQCLHMKPGNIGFCLPSTGSPNLTDLPNRYNPTSLIFKHQTVSPPTNIGLNSN